MIKVEKMRTYNWENALSGMRYPLDSNDRADTTYRQDGTPILGKNDRDLMTRLIFSGPEHRKFMRQIFVSLEITAPLYWWKEMDQYKVATTTDSSSTMHTIHKRPLTVDDFSAEHLNNDGIELLESTVDFLNNCRKLYVDDRHKKEQWWQLIQMLPSSFNQKRMWTGNYETLRSIYSQRRYHKLDEWKELCKALETLPESWLIYCDSLEAE